jgi:cyclopropane fatty-acyl-phospholipid synthase-like methyltransferase
MRGWLPAARDASMVDLACGSGWLLHFYQNQGYTNIQGVDLSAEQVELARSITPNVAQGDVMAFLESRSEHFDFISAFDLIEHLHKNEAVRFLDGCLNALKPGGRLVLQTPNSDSPMVCNIRYGDFTHELCFGANSISWVLRACGFRDVQIRELAPVPWGYSLKSSIRWLGWKGIRAALKLYNLFEVGTSGSGVFARVMLASAIKPAAAPER